MATSENKAKQASKTQEKAQTKAKPRTRTEQELLNGSVKDKITLVFRKATALAKQEGFKDTKLESVKFPGGAIYVVSGPEGKIQKMDENSDDFKNVKSLAKLAQKDIVEMKYTKAVRDFIDAVMSVRSKRADKTLDTSILKGLTL